MAKAPKRKLLKKKRLMMPQTQLKLTPKTKAKVKTVKESTPDNKLVSTVKLQENSCSENSSTKVLASMNGLPTGGSSSPSLSGNS